MRILLSGSKGFIGRALTSYFCKKKWPFTSLCHEEALSGEILWRAVDSSSLEDFDVVIHLAGEPLSMGRWSSEKKQKILSSRSEGTASLACTLARLRRPPSLWISASAVGYYGDRGEELLSEASSMGKGFLPLVCRAWEDAAKPIYERGSRVVFARFGVVLGRSGGILPRLVPLYKAGLGGRLGSGHQWMSWIALADVVSAICHILKTDSLHGPVNVVSPASVRQLEFSRSLASYLHRPAWTWLPSWACKCIFGQAASELVLSSARVSPKKLLDSGFQFDSTDLHYALRSEDRN